jgi:hypothetical protein
MEGPEVEIRLFSRRFIFRARIMTRKIRNAGVEPDLIEFFIFAVRFGAAKIVCRSKCAGPGGQEVARPGILIFEVVFGVAKIIVSRRRIRRVFLCIRSAGSARDRSRSSSAGSARDRSRSSSAGSAQDWPGGGIVLAGVN